jgi:hypothetical protein
MAGSCEHINEPSGSIKGGTFLDHLSDYQILREYSTSWTLSILIQHDDTVVLL